MEEMKSNHGKRDNQKLKPYLVQQYLLRNTDADHVLTSYDIIEFLESCGIAAERRSIYRDIEDINKVMWLMDVKRFDEEDDGITIEDAIAAYATPIIEEWRKKGKVDVKEMEALYKKMEEDLKAQYLK